MREKGQNNAMHGIHSDFFSLVRTFGSPYDSIRADCCVGATAWVYAMMGACIIVSWSMCAARRFCF